jgi:hypothetical protein
MKCSLLFVLVSVLLSPNITLSQNNIGIDTNVKIFRNLVVHQFNNNQSLSGVNLLEGIVVRADDNLKDIHLSDSNSTGINFFFRSGELGMDIIKNIILKNVQVGYDTRFGATITYMNMTPAQFDTVTRIPGFINLTSPENFFLTDRTDNYFGLKYFNAPLQYRTVYSFWLKGKSQISPHNIYGILYLKSARYNSLNDFEVTIDVKINTAGENYFGEILPGINNNNTNIDADYILFQNYPNPFNPSTVISYSLKENSFVTLKVFDITGREISVLVNERQNAGNYDVHFSSQSNKNSYDFPSGVYFYQLIANDFIDTKRMILLK